MNIILIIILINIILILSLKYSIYLALFFLIILSAYMIKIYYNIDNVLEGYTNKSNFEEEYRRNFFKLLNKNVKTDLDENILFNSIVGNFKELMKLLNVRDDVVPVNQMCKGEFSDWGKCDKKCGRGKKTRRFNELQKAGKTGIKCIYENGQEQSEECFERICNDGEKCEDDIDCLSGFCDRERNVCTYRNMCTVSQTQNCNFQECKALNDEFGEYSYNLEKNKCENIRKNGYLVKEAIGVGKTRDIFKELNSFIKDYNKKFKEDATKDLSSNLCDTLDISKGTKDCINLTKDTCNGAGQYASELDKLSIESGIKTCFFNSGKKVCETGNTCGGEPFAYCKDETNGKSGTTCSFITNDANSIPIYNDNYEESISPNKSGSFTGCLVHTDMDDVCGTLHTICPRGEYSRDGTGRQPCNKIQKPEDFNAVFSVVNGSEQVGDASHNASFICKEGYFWPGTGRPPQNEYGQYISGCLNCSGAGENASRCPKYNSSEIANFCNRENNHPKLISGKQFDRGYFDKSEKNDVFKYWKLIPDENVKPICDDTKKCLLGLYNGSTSNSTLANEACPSIWDGGKESSCDKWYGKEPGGNPGYYPCKNGFFEGCTNDDKNFLAPIGTHSQDIKKIKDDIRICGFYT